MTPLVQYILTGIAVFIAVGFLLRKFFPKKSKKACGSDDCGCH
ncbi:MAG: FeoB-associated Cys-rich membrane protein [Bacteroidetes bacterium]|jgi:glycopeptide antibiotics resistance protein|nr:FeoB-associated Cys-rich membrane protein [Bacteroidota bacterium]MDA0878967.1 FeoB-associated Cys-rich membrane protein [Bacteroidota bacterium]MDA1115874.1 FeoB-associated Cys-rich membrane protein [Bacteroidota bacterium]MDP4664920.1 FeoB-associated Cys-rich membrane protein [Flavobacteriaceae bacterium]